jgi:hypothetical protein
MEDIQVWKDLICHANQGQPPQKLLEWPIHSVLGEMTMTELIRDPVSISIRCWNEQFPFGTGIGLQY